MESALAGIILAFIARPIVAAANLCPSIRSAWDVIAPDIPYLGTACAAALLGSYLVLWTKFRVGKNRLLNAACGSQ